MTKIQETTIDKLAQDDKNFNKGTQFGEHLMDESISKFGLGRSILIDKNNRIIAGNKTAQKAGELGFERVVVVETDGNTMVAVKRTDIDLDSAQGRELALADNATSKANLAWDEETLKDVMAEYEEFIPEQWGVEGVEFDAKDDDDVDPDGLSNEEVKENNKSLDNDFIVPPLSIISTRDGRWNERAQRWKGIGVRSEVGRDSNLTYADSAQSPGYYKFKNALERQLGRKVSHEEAKEAMIASGKKMLAGTSIFDPALCEVLYTWFCPKGGTTIIDPFAGGSVRGIVASRLGYRYIGNDLRPEQIQANQKNADEIFSRIGEPLYRPTWTCGDSTNIKTILQEQGIHLDGGFDMIFSCPPYADLEVYSDNERDISNMSYDDFLQAYRNIIKETCSMLKDNRFAVFVVSEVRNKNSKKSFFRGFVQDTIQAFEDSGVYYYNHIILANQVASAATRCRKFMNSTRKITRVHQDVLVFYKGDIGAIGGIFGEVIPSDDAIIDLADWGSELEDM